MKDCQNLFENRRTFTKIKYEIASLERQVSPGNYTFPFKMALDPTRPASMSIVSKEKKCEVAKIYYKLKAQVTGLPENLKSSQTILIEMFNPIPLPIGPTHFHKEEMISSSCFGFRTPQIIKCTAILDKNAYAIGENMTLTVMVDATNFDKNLKVSVEMIQKIINNSIPYAVPMLESIQEAEMPSVSAGKKFRHSIMMNIPINIKPTCFNGVFFKCMYYINFKIHYGMAGWMNFRVYFTIYQLPKLELAPPVSLPPALIEEVYEAVMFDPSKIIVPY